MQSKKHIAILVFDAGLDGGKTKAMIRLALTLCKSNTVSLISIRKPKKEALRELKKLRNISLRHICNREDGKAELAYNIYKFAISTIMADKITKYLPRLHVDILYCPNYDSPLYYQLYQFTPKDVKIIIGDHGGKRYALLPKITKQYFQYGKGDRFFGYAVAAFDAIHVINPLVVHYYQDLRKKVFCIPNSVDDRECEISLLAEKKIIMVGRLAPDKLHIDGIRAFAGLCAEYPDWSLHVYGEGDQRQELQDYIDSENIKHCVFLEGYTTDIDKAYSQSSIYLSTSAFESFGLTFIEAMMHGLPIISTDGPLGAQYILSNGRGTLVPQGNIVMIEKALRESIQAVSTNSTILKKQIQYNTQYVQCFSQSNIASEWDKAFDQLLSSQQELGFNSSGHKGLLAKRIRSWFYKKSGY